MANGFGQPVFTAPRGQPVQPIDFGQIFMRPLQIAQQIEAARRQQIAADIAEQMAGPQLQTAQNQAATTALQLIAAQNAPRLAQEALQREAQLTPGMVSIPTDINVPIGRPNALTEMQQIALDEGMIRPQIAAPTYEIPRPGVPGFAFSEAELEADRARKAAQAVELARAKRREAGVTPMGVNPVTGKFMGFDSEKGERGEIVEMVQPANLTGPLAPKTTSAQRGLTEKQQNDYLTAATAVGLEPETFRDPESQQIDYKSLNIERGRKEGELAAEVRQSRVKRETQKSLTESQAKDVDFASMMLNANQDFDALEEGGYNPAKVRLENLVPGLYPKILRSEQKKLYDLAGSSFTQAVLRKQTGAAFTDTEVEWVGDRFLIAPLDPPSVIQTKKVNRLLASEIVARTATGEKLDRADIDAYIANARAQGRVTPEGAVIGGPPPAAGPTGAPAPALPKVTGVRRKP